MDKEEIQQTPSGKPPVDKVLGLDDDHLIMKVQQESPSVITSKAMILAKKVHNYYPSLQFIAVYEAVRRLIELEAEIKLLHPKNANLISLLNFFSEEEKE